jgi:hypothetical protein
MTGAEVVSAPQFGNMVRESQSASHEKVVADRRTRRGGVPAMRTSSIAKLCLSLAFVPTAYAATGPAIRPVVEIEEDVYSYEPADNGAGPLWCQGSTCLVRIGDDLFASGLETIKGVKPLNNCRWMLFHRSLRADAGALPAGRLSRRPAAAVHQSDAEHRSERLFRSRPARDPSVRRPRCRQGGTNPAARVVRQSQVHGAFLPELRRRWPES